MTKEKEPLLKKRININGMEISYSFAGQGIPMVLLHGWGTDSSSLAPVFDHFKEYFSVYNIDLPGFGDSPAPQDAWSVGDYADLVEAFIKKMDMDRPVILGHSFGGRLSIILSARNIPRKTVLVDAAGIRPKRTMKYYLRVYTYKCAKKLFALPGLNRYRGRALSLWLKKNPSSDYNAAEGMMRQIFVKVVNEDLKHYLPEIEVPTLLVWGENDTATPLSDGKLMEKMIPDSGLVVLNGAGHYSYLERLPQFLLILDSFLKDEMKAGVING